MRTRHWRQCLFTAKGICFEKVWIDCPTICPRWTVIIIITFGSSQYGCWRSRTRLWTRILWGCVLQIQWLLMDRLQCLDTPTALSDIYRILSDPRCKQVDVGPKLNPHLCLSPTYIGMCMCISICICFSRLASNTFFLLKLFSFLSIWIHMIHQNIIDSYQFLQRTNHKTNRSPNWPPSGSSVLVVAQ